MLQKDVDITLNRRVQALLAWITHYHSEYTCVGNRSVQATELTQLPKHIIALNKAIHNSLETCDKGLNFSAMDVSSLHLRVYADKSFAPNEELSSQLRFNILSCDKTGKCDVLDYAS